MAGSSEHQRVRAVPPPGAEVCRGLMRLGRDGGLAASITDPAEVLVLQAVPEDLTQARGEERKWAVGSNNGMKKRTLTVN